MKWNAWKWFILWGAVLLLVVAFVAKFREQDDVRIVSPREEAAVAEALLGEKLSGPRYFNLPLGKAGEEGGPWIGVSEVVDQLPRIAKERNLSGEETRKLGLLVNQMSEPHPYRVVGGERIDLTRLNLSLDSLGK